MPISTQLINQFDPLRRRIGSPLTAGDASVAPTGTMDMTGRQTDLGGDVRQEYLVSPERRPGGSSVGTIQPVTTPQPAPTQPATTPSTQPMFNPLTTISPETVGKLDVGEAPPAGYPTTTTPTQPTPTTSAPPPPPPGTGVPPTQGYTPPLDKDETEPRLPSTPTGPYVPPPEDDGRSSTGTPVGPGQHEPDPTVTGPGGSQPPVGKGDGDDGQTNSGAPGTPTTYPNGPGTPTPPTPSTPPVEPPAPPAEPPPVDPQAPAEEEIPHGLRQLADFLAARLNSPGPYGDDEIQAIRDAFAVDRDRRQGDAVAGATSDAARRGVYFGTPLTSGLGEIAQGFERDTLAFDNELMDRIVQAREGRTESTINQALQFLGMANNEQQARDQLALAAAQIAQAGGIDPNSVLALLMGMGDGDGGGIDPQLYALLGSLFQGEGA